MRVAPGVLVDPAPLVPRRRELVGGQRAGAGGEAAGQNDALLAVPLLVVLQNPSVRGQILAAETNKHPPSDSALRHRPLTRPQRRKMGERKRKDPDLRGELGELVRLRVHPPEWLQVVQELVLGESRGEVDLLVGAPLRGHGYAPDLLHLRVILGAQPIEIPADLGPEVRHTDELLQDVLGHDVRVPRFLRGRG